jgi:hypothetical protein
MNLMLKVAQLSTPDTVKIKYTCRVCTPNADGPLRIVINCFARFSSKTARDSSRAQKLDRGSLVLLVPLL